MDVAKSETFRNFTILEKALLFLIKFNKTAVQSVPQSKNVIYLQRLCFSRMAVI